MSESGSSGEGSTGGGAPPPSSGGSTGGGAPPPSSGGSTGGGAPRECIFCRIVAGDLPAEEVASSPLTFAFRDNKPAMPSHVLVVPREHIESAATVEPDHAALLAELFQTAQEVAAGEGLEERGYRLVLNVGKDAQNSVPHLHLHVLGGRPMDWPPG